MRKIGPYILLAACALVLYLIVAFSMSITYDEDGHYSYGWKILCDVPERTISFWDSKMPITALNVLPHFAAEALLDWKRPSLNKISLEMIEHARVITVAASIGLMALLMAWSTRLWGRSAGLASGVLFCLSPNLMAHGTLVTTDLYMALAATAVLYTHWRFAQTWRLRDAIIAAVALAIAQITKYSCLLLIPVAFLSLLPSLWFELRKKGTPGPWRVLSVHALTTLVAAILLINITFCCQGTFTPLRDYLFRTPEFQRLAQIPVLSTLPLPLPVPYLDGIDFTHHHEHTGETFGNLYLLGEIRSRFDPYSKPFYSYYLVAYFFKEPIALQLLFLSALVFIGLNFNLQKFACTEWFMVCPILVYFIVQTISSREQIGLRHLLVIFPFMILISSSQFREWAAFTKQKRLTYAALLAWAAVSVFSYYPQMIPYMNEFVFNRLNAWKILADSNLTWGQSDDAMKEFLKANPDVKFNPRDPVSGRVLADVNAVSGVWRKHSMWLQRYEPIGHVGYMYLLYNIPPQPGQPEDLPVTPPVIKK